MFEISKLKEKKLSELQEIAENLKISKFKTLKKLDLVYKILDHQASNPEEKESNQEKSDEKAKNRFKPRNKSHKKEVKKEIQNYPTFKEEVDYGN